MFLGSRIFGGGGSVGAGLAAWGAWGAVWPVAGVAVFISLFVRPSIDRDFSRDLGKAVAAVGMNAPTTKRAEMPAPGLGRAMWAVGIATAVVSVVVQWIAFAGAAVP
jgi:hypothetical protein